jgi:hypothetical protein
MAADFELAFFTAQNPSREAARIAAVNLGDGTYNGESILGHEAGLSLAFLVWKDIFWRQKKGHSEIPLYEITVPYCIGRRLSATKKCYRQERTTIKKTECAHLFVSDAWCVSLTGKARFAVCVCGNYRFSEGLDNSRSTSIARQCPEHLYLRSIAQFRC